jgi:hypothetical protein
VSFSDEELAEVRGNIRQCLPHNLTTTTYGTLQRLLERLDAAEAVCRALAGDVDTLTTLSKKMAAWRASCGE